jgi:hypothetical protein
MGDQSGSLWPTANLRPVMMHSTYPISPMHIIKCAGSSKDASVRIVLSVQKCTVVALLDSAIPLQTDNTRQRKVTGTSWQ